LELKTKHYYDDETMEFVASKFFIDNEQVDIDVYMDYCNELEKINGDCECNCDSCERDDCCEKCTEEDCCNECDGYIDDEIYIEDEMDCGISKECIDCDDTECENQISSEELEELKILYDFTNEILKRDGCVECIFGLLGDLYVKGKKIGYKDCEDKMREFLG